MTLLSRDTKKPQAAAGTALGRGSNPLQESETITMITHPTVTCQRHECDEYARPHALRDGQPTHVIDLHTHVRLEARGDGRWLLLLEQGEFHERASMKALRQSISRGSSLVEWFNDSRTPEQRVASEIAGHLSHYRMRQTVGHVRDILEVDYNQARELYHGRVAYSREQLELLAAYLKCDVLAFYFPYGAKTDVQWGEPLSEALARAEDRLRTAREQQDERRRRSA